MCFSQMSTLNGYVTLIQHILSCSWLVYIYFLGTDTLDIICLR